MSTKVIFASTRDSDMHYAVKTNITGPFFYVEKANQKLAFLDKREYDFLKNHKAKPSKLRIVPVESIFEEANKLKLKTSARNKLALTIFKKYGLLRKKVEVPSHFPLDMADFLRKHGAKIIPVYPFFPMRAVKTETELACIRKSAEHTKLAFEIIEKILRGSIIRKNRIYYRGAILSSEFLRQEAEKALIEKGMFDLLGMIVSTGKQTAIPHHPGSGPILPHQPIVCDIFPRHRESGYFSDMTRTYVKGKPSGEVVKMYEAVSKAQAASMKKIRAGIPAAKIYQAAADVFRKLGFDVGKRGFTHALGHGVGLDIHEKPSLKPSSEEVLKAGNIITVEPGLYYPEIGGVRVEDIVLVTKKGYTNLTNYPKKLAIK